MRIHISASEFEAKRLASLQASKQSAGEKRERDRRALAQQPSIRLRTVWDGAGPAGAHVRLLRQAKASGGERAREVLRCLQRKCGNRHVRRVVRLSEPDQGELAVGRRSDIFEREGNSAPQVVVRREGPGLPYDADRKPVPRQVEENEEEPITAKVDASQSSRSGFDHLSESGEISGEAIDRIDNRLKERIIQRQPATPARPTQLIQILTGWTPGPARYGFQLKFRCRSTSGRVSDLQSQPNLGWREHVTYTRNDFSHRIAPPSPTILPAAPGGIPFTAATTRRVGRNLLEFNTARDTHWMPTSAVRAADFAPAGPRPLPAKMESRQLYQYTTDGGGSWRYFAGAFIIRRTLFRSGGALRFRTRKVRIHTVTEPYKP